MDKMRDRDRRERRDRRDRRDRDDRRRDRRDRRDRDRKFHALDPHSMPCGGRNDDTQHAEQSNKTVQLSDELIEVVDSCDVRIITTDTKGALNLQAGLQAALLIVVTISIFGGDVDKAEKFTQDLVQTAKVKQLNYQETYVENSRDVTIETSDRHIAINIQLLLQLLLAVAVIVDIF
ncbi:spore coat protein [Alteribacillus iranensis]|uniref:Spore coat protein X n=1 Tax=Alteribacillus iranensis TaxID=930128 RepID=A0A1I2DNH4_9BACI|nr:spore coat protein [Alteribacillus iranensis]SFE81460.1 spore coat protein X [Alteribacillus iranensis]